MSGPADQGGGGASAPGGEEGRRRVVAYLRHELRTSLTAILGYSEHLLESAAADGSAEMERGAEELKRLGDTLLGHVNERLGADAISGLSGDALPQAVRDLGAACLAPAAEIKPRCASLIAAAEREGKYALIPVICRIQAAGVMLSGLLEGYSIEAPSKTLWAGLPARVDPPRPSGPVGAVAAERRGRVLIVDDNSINRDLLRQWLEQQGHDVEEAGGGQAALERVRTNDYDLILLDLIMPDLSGLEVLAALRSEGRLDLVPVIMLSASDELDGVVRCIEQGADDYMTRPFNMVLLRARIRSCLELKRHRQREQAYMSLLLERGARAGADGDR